MYGHLLIEMENKNIMITRKRNGKQNYYDPQKKKKRKKGYLYYLN